MVNQGYIVNESDWTWLTADESPKLVWAGLNFSDLAWSTQVTKYPTELDILRPCIGSFGLDTGKTL